MEDQIQSKNKQTRKSSMISDSADGKAVPENDSHFKKSASIENNSKTAKITNIEDNTLSKKQKSATKNGIAKFLKDKNLQIIKKESTKSLTMCNSVEPNKESKIKCKRIPKKQKPQENDVTIDNLATKKYKKSTKLSVAKTKPNTKETQLLPESQLKNDDKPWDLTSSKSELLPPSNRPSMDAFQFMMEARKKSIGMNSPGKELPECSESKDVSPLKSLKAKRSLALSLWADQKGASKKKELEELHDKQIKEAMDKRAQTLKKMLQQGSKRKKKKTLNASEKLKNSVAEFEDIFNGKATGNNSKRKKRVHDSKSDLDTAKKIKLQSPIQSNENSSTNDIKKLQNASNGNENKIFLSNENQNSPHALNKIKKSSNASCENKKSSYESCENKKSSCEINKSSNASCENKKLSNASCENKKSSNVSCENKKSSNVSRENKKSPQVSNENKKSHQVSSENKKSPQVSSEAIKPPCGKLNISDDEFLDKLSPSLKKKESMLSYFKKQNENEKNVDCVSEDEFCDKESDILKLKMKSISKKIKKTKKKLKLKAKPKHPKTDPKKLLKEIPNSNEKNSLKINEKNSLKIDSSNIKEKTIETSEKSENPVVTKCNEVIIECDNSSRPRRTIRKPIKYTQESSEDTSGSSDSLEIFPFVSKKKILESKRKKGKTDKENFETIVLDDKVSPLKIIHIQSPGKLQCIKSPKVQKNTALSQEKLAPLFRNFLPKPVIDPSVLEARKIFLQSGVPESIKKHFDKTSNTLSDTNIFFSVDHVQQIPDQSDHNYDIWNLPSTRFVFDFDVTDTPVEYSTDENLSHCFEQFGNINDINNSNDSCFKIFSELQNYDYKEGLRIIKTSYPNFPVYKTFKQLWEKKCNVSKCLNSQISNKTDSEEIVEESNNIDINFSLWTEKYKPLKSHDILGNFKPVILIKRWIENWKEYNEMNKTNKRTRRDSDSSNDFYTSDSESRDSSRIPNNVMVVTGPPGSGKTSCIYAIANELGINVLEVNASSKRTGRKILSELHEATQSHKVLTKFNPESSMNSFVNCIDKSLSSKENNCSNGDSGNSIHNKSKKSLLQDKTKKKRKVDLKVLSGEIYSQKSSEANIMSLMLIDDADVVFEEDDGFIGALGQLVQSSKRPVLIVASDINCTHLQRFMTNTNVINFQPLAGVILGPWIDIILLLECNKIIPKLSCNLLEFFKGDVRSSLLQLQYWFMGNMNSKNEEKINKLGDNMNENDILSSPLEEWSDEDSNISWHNKQGQNDDLCNTVSLNKDKESERIIQKKILAEMTEVHDLGNIWWNITAFFQPQQNPKIENTPDGQKLNDLHLNNINYLIDCLSVVDIMQSCSKCNDKSNFARLPWKTCLKDSISESENFSMFKHHEYVSSDWCQYILKESFKRNRKDLKISEEYNMAFVDLRDFDKKQKIHSELSEAIYCGAQLDRRSVTLDYMATLRTMCRSEKVRSKNNFKRNNRFHNYLNSLNISVKEKNLECISRIFEFNPS